MARRLCLSLVSGAYLCLVLKGCGKQNPSPNTEPALEYLGGRCNTVTGDSCNPAQLPLFSGESYNPSRLFEASRDQIIYDHNEHFDQDTHVSLVQSVSEVSSRNTGDFGLSGSLPFENSAFSGSTEYQTLAQKMDVCSSVNFYASIQRRYTTYSVSLSKGAKAKLIADFHDAVSSLPPAPQSDEEYDKWFDFFQKFGTHYVKEVSFGGVMRLTVFLRSTVEQTEEVKERNWDFDLEAIFNQHAGLNVSFGGDRTEKQLDSFPSYLMDEKFVAYGGQPLCNSETFCRNILRAVPGRINWDFAMVMGFATFPPTAAYAM